MPRPDQNIQTNAASCRGKWGNPGQLFTGPHRYNTNHGYAEQSLSLLRTSNIATSYVLFVTLNP